MLLYRFATPELDSLPPEKKQAIVAACSASPRLRGFNSKAQALAWIPVLGIVLLLQLTKQRPVVIAAVGLVAVAAMITVIIRGQIQIIREEIRKRLHEEES